MRDIPKNMIGDLSERIGKLSAKYPHASFTVEITTATARDRDIEAALGGSTGPSVGPNASGAAGVDLEMDRWTKVRFRAMWPPRQGTE